MEQKLDYAELKRLRFEQRDLNYKPSHSKYQTDFDEPSINAYAEVSDLMIATQHIEDRLPFELRDLKLKLSQHANDIINRLYAKYGIQTYSKMVQLMKSEAFSEWAQLEQELLSGNFELLIEEEDVPVFNEADLQNLNIEEEFGSPLRPLDDDLNYLDALAQHDYKRLSKFQSEECLSSIFSEIIENEHQPTINYEEDTFKKNIQLIFNDHVDLDDVNWQAHQQKQSPLMATNLNEAINELKQQPAVQKSSETQPLSAQANLNAFYAESVKDAIDMAEVVAQEEASKVVESNHRKAWPFIMMGAIFMSAIVILWGLL